MALFRCSSGAGGGGMSETVLWTNSNPSSAFASQSISLSDDISNYEYIKIEYKRNATDANTVSMMMSVADFLTPQGTSNVKILGIHSVYANGNFCRMLTYSSGTSLSFGVAYQCNAAYNQNSASVPIKVIGVK